MLFLLIKIRSEANFVLINRYQVFSNTLSLPCVYSQSHISYFEHSYFRDFWCHHCVDAGCEPSRMSTFSGHVVTHLHSVSGMKTEWKWKEWIGFHLYSNRKHDSQLIRCIGKVSGWSEDLKNKKIECKSVVLFFMKTDNILPRWSDCLCILLDFSFKK